MEVTELSDPVQPSCMAHALEVPLETGGIILP